MPPDAGEGSTVAPYSFASTVCRRERVVFSGLGLNAPVSNAGSRFASVNLWRGRISSRMNSLGMLLLPWAATVATRSRRTGALDMCRDSIFNRKPTVMIYRDVDC